MCFVFMFEFYLFPMKPEKYLRKPFYSLYSGCHKLDITTIARWKNYAISGVLCCVCPDTPIYINHALSCIYTLTVTVSCELDLAIFSCMSIHSCFSSMSIHSCFSCMSIHPIDLIFVSLLNNSVGFHYRNVFGTRRNNLVGDEEQQETNAINRLKCAAQ